VSPAGTFTEVADERSIDADFRSAGRIFGLDLARKYADHTAVPADDDDGLLEAHVLVAALAQVQGIKEELDGEADKLAKRWLTEYRVAIKNLSDERRATYDEIVGMSREPQRIEILRPRVRAEETEDADGRKVATRALHLMSDENGEFPISSLNQWAVEVLDSEMSQPGFRAWYRNPSRASNDSLAIAYVDARGNWRRMSPDFLFFSGDDDEIRVSVVDPHGVHPGDALPKLRGLARFAVEYGHAFHRIEAVAKMKDEVLRVLDLQKHEVRTAIDTATDAEQLYLSDAATDY
jgi:hypothetical protein